MMEKKPFKMTLLPLTVTERWIFEKDGNLKRCKVPPFKGDMEDLEPTSFYDDIIILLAT